MRLPVDRINTYKQRETLWTEMRRRKNFTIPQITELTTYDPSSVTYYINSLIAAGYVKKMLRGGRINGRLSPAVYRLIKDAPEPPRVRLDGSPVTQGAGRDQMWRSMRILKRFSVQDLTAASSTEEHRVAESEARTYCQALARAGYLRKEIGGYAFARFTGPKAPQIQRVKRIWDPNLKKVVWPLSSPLTAGGTTGGSPKQ